MTSSLSAEAQRRLEYVRPLLGDIDELKNVKTGKPARAIRYNMLGFFRQCVEVYCDLAKVTPESLRKVATPGMKDHLC